MRRGLLPIAAASLALAPVRLAAWEPPVEAPRLQQSSLTAVYAPTFGLLGDVALPMHDNYWVEGSWVNLFPRGRNLNFYFGSGHAIKDLAVYPEATAEREGFVMKEQARDSLYGKFTYVFLDYWQFEGIAEYVRNRLVEASADYADYDFDRAGFSGGLVLDLRYSSIEKYYKGKKFLFPEQGFRLGAGLRENAYLAASGGSREWAPQAFGEAQFLAHPGPFWTISLNASCDANVGSGSPRVQEAASKVLGAFETAGDYAADGFVELRFLHPSGIFWESPEFWYIASFLFKFSPGFVLGYNAGLSGMYSSASPLLQQSVYASPLVAIRMNGELVSVIRADLAFSSSGIYKVVISLSFGTVGAGKPDTLVKKGLR